ncbi:MAG: outer membrane protein assembly factor BamC [Pseudomonadota bacterium]
MLLIGTLLLSGCGFLFGDKGVFRDPSEDYKQAPEVPELRVPTGMDSDALGEIYVIPKVQESLVPAGEFEVPRPAPLVTGSGAEVVRIQRLGDEQWVLVELAPGQVWPQVRAFLSAAGMQVTSVDARAGIIDTNWLQLEGRPMASRFRFRMEQGVQRGTSELHVLQMNQAGDGQTWPSVSDDLGQEADMLQAVAQFLADSADSSPVSMVAEQGIRASGKISLQESNEGYTYIRLELPYDRAWASLGRALEKSAFDINDRDRSTGIYYTTFVGPDEVGDEGFMDWLWDSEDAHPMSGQGFTVAMESIQPDVVAIRLEPADADALFDKREEQSMLALIKGNIN